jgi:hypothetical protein
VKKSPVIPFGAAAFTSSEMRRYEPLPSCTTATSDFAVGVPSSAVSVNGARFA